VFPSGGGHVDAGLAPITTPLLKKKFKEAKHRMDDRLRVSSSTVSAIFIGKWTVKIVSLLRERPHRHGELRRRLGNVSQRMLTKTLRNLESSGLIVRRVAQSKPLAVEYSLTQLGRSFLAPLGSMCRWADRHGKELSAVVHLAELRPDPPA